jgi:hypothetical protein
LLGGSSHPIEEIAKKLGVDFSIAKNGKVWERNVRKSLTENVSNRI